MKEYEIIEGRKYLLKGTTARVEQALAEIGLSSQFVTIDDSPETVAEDSDTVMEKIFRALCNLCHSASVPRHPSAISR